MKFKMPTWLVVVTAALAAALCDKVLCLLVLGDFGWEPAEGGLGGNWGDMGASPSILGVSDSVMLLSIPESLNGHSSPPSLYNRN